jgi:membrane fusion protein (multidrug efflux system)
LRGRIQSAALQQVKEDMQNASAPADRQALRVHREAASPPRERKRGFFQRPGVTIGAAVLAIAGIFYGAGIVFHVLTHETTDDAFIDAHSVSVAPKVAGRIASVPVDDNQLVKKGDVLIEIGPRDFQAALAQARANLAKDKAMRIQAEANEKRALDLFYRKVISAQDRDVDVAAAETSRANVQADEAAVEQAELNLGYTKIKAPIDGYVTNKSVTPGDYVQVGQMVMALVPMHVWVTANFKETQLRDMRPGQPATIHVDAYPNLRLQGHVDSVQAGSGAAFSLLPPENATGNYVKVVQRVPVKIVLDTPADPQHVLGPGMSVEPDVRISSGSRAAVEVIAGVVLAISLVIIGAGLWIRKIRSTA